MARGLTEDSAAMQTAGQILDPLPCQPEIVIKESIGHCEWCGILDHHLAAGDEEVRNVHERRSA